MNCENGRLPHLTTHFDCEGQRNLAMSATFEVRKLELQFRCNGEILNPSFFKETHFGVVTKKAKRVVAG